MTGRTARRHIARSLAEEMKMSYVHAGVGLPRGIQPKQREWWLNFEEQVANDDEGDMGVAILSRMPLTDVELIDLPWHECPWHPRVAVAATIIWRDEKVRLFNAHIDPHGPLDNQHQQTEAVLERAKQHDGPTVVLGDFNTLSKEKAIQIRRLMESHGYTTPFPTDIRPGAAQVSLRFHAIGFSARGGVQTLGVAKPLKRFRSLADLVGDNS